jgi:hypothetical protein
MRDRTDSLAGDLGALLPNARERSVAERILLDLHHTWEDARTEARAKAVLTVLRVRGVAVPATARKRILAENDLKKLERWLEEASVATSIEEVIGHRG